VIAPWEVEALPDEWILAAREITTGQKKRAEHRAAEHKVDQMMAAWRSSHPIYKSRN